MKRLSWAAGLAGTLWLAVAAVAGAQAPDLSRMDVVLKSVPDGPVAIVDGRPVSARDFTELYKRQLDVTKERLKKEPSDEERVKIGVGVLASLIENEVLLREAERRKLTVDEADLDKAWQKEMKYMQAHLAPDKTALGEAEVLTLAGTTREEARADLNRTLLIEKAAISIAKEKKVAVSDADVAKFLEERAPKGDPSTRYHVKHILIKAQPLRGKITEEDRAKARQKAETALNTIRSGRSFESVAKEVSEGPGKEQGGDLGMLTVGQLPPFLVPTVQSLKAGQLSEVVESEYGYHLVQLVETSAGEKLDMEKLRPVARNALFAEKGEKVVKEFVRQATDAPGVLQVYLRLPNKFAARPETAASPPAAQ